MTYHMTYSEHTTPQVGATCDTSCDTRMCHILVSHDVSGLRSQVVYSKQPKLGLTQEFVVLLVRMRLVVCMFVCLFVCLFVITCLFVLQAI